MPTFTETAVPRDTISTAVQTFYEHALWEAGTERPPAVPVIPGYNTIPTTDSYPGWAGAMANAVIPAVYIGSHAVDRRTSIDSASPGSSYNHANTRAFTWQDAALPTHTAVRDDSFGHQPPVDDKNEVSPFYLSANATLEQAKIAQLESLWDDVAHGSKGEKGAKIGKIVGSAAVWHMEGNAPSNTETQRLFAGSHDIVRHRGEESRTVRFFRSAARMIGYTVLITADTAAATVMHAQHSWHS